MTSRAVLVAGAINTDLVARVGHAPEAGETVTGTRFDIFGGGKGANQALAAARSGARVAMLGGLGDDDFGHQRLHDLRHDGIDVNNVAITGDAASGVALITVDESGQNRIAYVAGATRSVGADQAIAAFERLRPRVVLTTLEIPLASLEALYGVARAAGAIIVLNATPEPESGRDLVPACDVLIVNESEAGALLGGERGDDWQAVASSLRQLGPRTVIITLGAEGMVAAIGDRIARAAAPVVEVIDTTGAGDAFCGAFAAWLASGADELAAVTAGIAAGSLAVTEAGAQRSMPKRVEIERLMSQIVIQA